MTTALHPFPTIHEAPDHRDVATDPACILAPETVRTLRVLGHGRAAVARLVEAQWPDGRRITCVEKVFAPGLLTRVIYRLAFQSPFAYQSNFDAIAASFYRRRVAAAAFELAGLKADVAEPLYVRYDAECQAWVLAAKWIDGRGIRPAKANDRSLRGLVARGGRWVAQWFRRQATSPELTSPGSIAWQPRSEIQSLVALMRKLEVTLADCGLIGSGWQVAPAALVSTANLLRNRRGDAPPGNSSPPHADAAAALPTYTVVDLESGIPAVLVPRYVIAGLQRGILPMFEDIDATRMQSWLDQSMMALQFRSGSAATEQLQADVSRLIEHTARWKESEFALLRRPWRHFTRRGATAYQQQVFQRWQAAGTVDDQSAAELGQRPWFAACLWWLGWIPTSLGRRVQCYAGNQQTRFRVKRWLHSRALRQRLWHRYRRHCRLRWEACHRIPGGRSDASFSVAEVTMHRMLQSTTRPGLHRWIVDADRRRVRRNLIRMALFNARYQARLGRCRIESSIRKWQDRDRLSNEEAESLRRSLSGDQVVAYARGFGMHLGLKATSPVVGPAKVAGMAAYLAGGSMLFLLIPFLLTPLLRSVITLASMASRHGRGKPHGEALLWGWLPMVGTIAFPVQMFAARRELSIFLIRDAAATIGQHLPIYGGPDSRTELAMIRASDAIIEVMTCMTGLFNFFRQSLGQFLGRPAEQLDSGGPASDASLLQTAWPSTIPIAHVASPRSSSQTSEVAESGSSHVLLTQQHRKEAA